MKADFFIAAVLASGIALSAHASFEGDFSYHEYDLNFESGLFPSIGHDKIVTAGNSDITVTQSGFSGIFQETMLERSISNLYVMGIETRCVNAYAIEFMTDSESLTGTVAQAAYAVLNIHPGDEPDITLPFYFCRNTNIALNLSAPSPDFPYETGAGLLIRKGSGMDNSAAHGTYIRYTMGNAAGGITPYGMGNIDRVILDRAVMEFDGSGNYTEEITSWSIERTTDEMTVVVGSDSVEHAYCTLSYDETTESTNGTYSVLPDGTILISSEIGFITNQLSPDGTLAASTLGFGSVANLTVVLRQPDNMPTNAIDAVFFLAEIEEGFNSTIEIDGINNNTVSLGRSYVFLASDGTFSIRSDFWGVANELSNLWTDADPDPGSTNLVAITQFHTEGSERTIEFEHGTYSLQADGVVLLDFGNGDTGQAQLSANGEYLVYGFAYGADDGTAARSMGFGIRRDPPAPPSASVVFNNDISMTPTGLVMTAMMPTNYPLEGIGTDDLPGGEWYSGGIFSTDTGTVHIHDPDATNSASGFYAATFVPW